MTGREVSVEASDKELCAHRRIPESGDRLLTYFLVRLVGSDSDVRRGCSPSPQERGGIIDRTIASQPASGCHCRARRQVHA